VQWRTDTKVSLVSSYICLLQHPVSLLSLFLRRTALSLGISSSSKRRDELIQFESVSSFPSWESQVCKTYGAAVKVSAQLHCDPTAQVTWLETCASDSKRSPRGVCVAKSSSSFFPFFLPVPLIGAPGLLQRAPIFR